MIQKIVEAGPLVQLVLYTNVQVRETDSLEARRQKGRVKSAACNYIKSRRRRLEALILSNFDSHDWYVTLTFDDQHLPAKREDMVKFWGKFLRRLRKAGCRDVKYIRVLEHKHGAARWHIHAVLKNTPPSKIKKCFWEGKIEISRLEPERVVPHRTSSGLASYFAKEAPDKVGLRGYSASKGLAKPTITRRYVSNDYQLAVPSGCRPVSGLLLAVNAFGTSSYLSYWKNERGERGVRA